MMPKDTNAHGTIFGGVILSYIDQLREVDVAGFEWTDPADATPLRDDVPRPPIDRDAVAANAPAFSDDGHFIVPKVIGD